MLRRVMGAGAVAVCAALTTGCCRWCETWCDKWCAPQTRSYAAPAQVCYPVICQPVCCQPATTPPPANWAQPAQQPLVPPANP